MNYFFKHVTERHPTLKFSSIEIYHRNGYPMVTNPSHYFKLVREFSEDEFRFIFIIPKKLYIIDRITFPYSNLRMQYIPIMHMETRSNFKVKLLINRILRIEDLKHRSSLQFHLPYSTLSFNLKHTDGTMEHNLEDSIEVNVENILNQDYTLYLSVSEHYWEPNYLNAFKLDNYFPTTTISNDSLINLNVYLLSLVQLTSISKRSSVKFTKCLGLLRQISCFPPLINSLWSLYAKNTITLPHKIAIIEGLINTVKILYGTWEIEKQFDFSCLWAYLEQNSNLSHFEDETYQFNLLKDNVNDLFKSTDLECRKIPRLIHSHRSIRKDFSTLVSSSFISEHPIDIYRRYVSIGHCYGLTRIFHNNVLISCVFYDCINTYNTPLINCYSPFHGDILSINPFAVSTPEKFNVNSYCKLLIILDVSGDMNCTLDGLKYTLPNISKEDTFFQLDTALFLIDIIVDTLHSRNLQYLLGITLVSNDHGFEDGHHVLQELTLDYHLSIEKLRKWIQSHPPTKYVTRPPQGGIYYALNYYLRCDYVKSPEIYIFTNQGYQERFYGSNVQTITNSISKSYRVNAIIFGAFGNRFESLCKKSQGRLLNSRSFYSKSAKNAKDPMFYFSKFREYVNHTREMVTETTTSPQFPNLSKVLKHYKNLLSKADSFTNKHLSSKTQSRVTLSILERISNYLTNPNPFVSLYCINNDVRKWLLFFKSPPNTDFYGSEHVVSLTFSEIYLHQPPTLQFLTPILHPNIHRNGKICHPILLEDYYHTTTLKMIIDSIHSMLCKPIRTHVINRAIGELFLLGTDMYRLQILSVKDAVCMDIPCGNHEKSLDTTLTTSANAPVVPHDLICPLTRELFRVPVITPDGNTFEKNAILQYLETFPKDPLSGNYLTEELLFPNHTFADRIREYI